MTCLVVLETATDLDEMVTVGEEVRRFSAANSLMGLKENEEISVRDLLYGTMLPSGNDAAATLACHFGGSIEGFAEMMNRKAKELGMDNTHFVNPHGLTDEEHYTTAADMAILTRAAMQNEALMKIVGTPVYTTSPTNKHKDGITVETTNRFISKKEKSLASNWKYVTGMKTAVPTAAQGCLVTTASKDGKNLLTVILGDSSKDYENRWSESRSLLEYGFENLATMPIAELNLAVPTQAQAVSYSRKDINSGIFELSLVTEGKTISGLKDHLEEIKTNAGQVEITVTYNTELTAPITKGDIVGTATLKYGTETLAVLDVAAARDVASAADDTIIQQSNNLITNVVNTESGGVSPWLIGPAGGAGFPVHPPLPAHPPQPSAAQAQGQPQPLPPAQQGGPAL